MDTFKISPVIFCQSLVDNHAHSLGKESIQRVSQTSEDLSDVKVNNTYITPAIYYSAVKKKQTAYLHLMLAHRPQWRASQCMDSQTNRENQ